MISNWNKHTPNESKALALYGTSSQRGHDSHEEERDISIHLDLGLCVEEGIGKLLSFTQRTLDDFEIGYVGVDILNGLIWGLLEPSLGRSGCAIGTSATIGIYGHCCDIVSVLSFLIDGLGLAGEA